MESKKEVILQNTVLENVFGYLVDRLRQLSGEVVDQTDPDGTMYAYNIQNALRPTSNRIEVRYTTVITPQGNNEKAHGSWGNWPAMSFEGRQLQVNTVLIIGECHHPFALPLFNDHWNAMLRAFGSGQGMNTIADNQGGTVTYIRNDQGQTIMMGGTLNPGYAVAIGQNGGAIGPEARFWVEHTGTMVPERSGEERGPQLKTQNSLKRLREIRCDAIMNGRPIPTKAAAMDEADITDKTWKRYDAELWARWDDRSYRPEKQQ